MSTRLAALKFFSLVRVFPVCMHEVDRKDAEQTVQYLSDQGLFLTSVNLVWYVSPVCVKGMAMKSAEPTVQIVRSDQGLFVAGAKCRGYEKCRTRLADAHIGAIPTLIRLAT